MKSFYEFYNKLQKINEENQGLNPAVVDSNPSAPQADMGMDMKADKGTEMDMQAPSQDVPMLTDKTKEGDNDESNLSPPEGKINYKFINKNLKHISKYISKFKNLDQEKGEQLEQLIGQIKNLVNSFEEPSSEEESGEEETSSEEPVSTSPDSAMANAGGDKNLAQMVGDTTDMSAMSTPEQPSMNMGEPSIA